MLAHVQGLVPYALGLASKWWILLSGVCHRITL